MLRTICSILHLAQLAISAGAGYHSYVAITNLQQYEETSEKAAKFSNTAANQLYKTRTTQASSALAILASAASASVLLFARPERAWLRVSLGLVNALSTFAARAHVRNFWQAKSKVPLVQGYNEGVQSSKTILQYLKVLAATWAVSIVLTGFNS